jgi:hypothetical protein
MLAGAGITPLRIPNPSHARLLGLERTPSVWQFARVGARVCMFAVPLRLG